MGHCNGLRFPRFGYKAKYKNEWTLKKVIVLKHCPYNTDEYIISDIETGKKSNVKKWQILDKENYDREKLINHFM